MSAELPWSAQQREWLAALGHDVFALADATPPVEAAPAAAVPAAPVRPDARQVDRASALPAGRDATTPASTRPAAARAPMETALLRALAQAAGRTPDDGEFLRALPPLASLRGNPAARRALWPRLRALRRGAGA